MRLVAGMIIACGLLMAPLSALSSGAALAQVQTLVSVSDIAGTYSVNGRNPDGSNYTGSVTISDDLGAAKFVWKVGSRTYRGSGRFLGNVLVVDWGDTHPVVYTVGVTGNLSGTWADGVASEKLTRR